MSDQTENFIILKKTKYSESDLIIHALSAEGTKKSFIAKFALKSKKRFGGGVLEPTHYVRLTYKPAKSDEGLNILNEALLLDDFKEIRLNFDKIEFALQIMNCVYHVSQEGDQDSHFLFNLVGHTLRFLNQCEITELGFLKLHFYLKFLFQQGVVSIEPWMAPFLKTNITDLRQIFNMETVSMYLDSIELMVFNYIKTAQI